MLITSLQLNRGSLGASLVSALNLAVINTTVPTLGVAKHRLRWPMAAKRYQKLALINTTVPKMPNASPCSVQCDNI